MEHPRPRGSQTNFAYPNYKQPQPIPEYAQPSQYEQYQHYQTFPPHPSVRPSPNVKLSARQVPAGVGVAPPPVKYGGQQRPQQKTPPDGTLLQDFKFPAAPPIPASRPSRGKQEQSQPSGRKYNMHESYMSSVVDDVPSTSTTPGSRSRGFPTPREYSGSVYAENEAFGLEELSGPGPESSAPSSPEPSPQIVRQASIGKRAKPAMTTIKNRTSQLEQDIPEHPPAPGQTSRNAAMNALSAAVASGISIRPNEDRSGTPGSRSYTPVRMPFDTSPPGSPSADREFLQTPKSPQTIASTNMLEQTPASGHSRKSTNPLLGLGIEQHSSISSKIPASRRPPRLDMDAVKEAENRGSTTSLADLIKRATRLAANLDRGRTASRLGMLDMFGSSERLDGANRHSTMSDMISAFPAPAAGGTPTTRRGNEWPLGEKGDAYASTTDLSKSQQPPLKQRRKCCGLSMPVFFSLIVVVIILIAAAVLIPIFLILVPKQHRNTQVSGCAASHPCRNGGSSISSGTACVCVCSNGFTGSQCDTAGNTDECMAKTIKDGLTEYKNATLGRSILSPLSDAQTRFDIPLNVSTILSVFSSNNLSCTSENSLVDFNSSASTQGTKTKRFIILPGLDPPVSERLAVIQGKFQGKPHMPAVTMSAHPDAEVHVERRQNAGTVGTSNGIVFQATSATASPVSSASESIGTSVAAVTSASGTAGSDPSPTGSSPGSASTGTDVKPSTITDEQVEFAKVVVLYVLQESRTISVAIEAQRKVETFFDSQAKGSSNSTVDVVSGNLDLTADFSAFSITKGDGRVVGGKQD